MSGWWWWLVEGGLGEGGGGVQLQYVRTSSEIHPSISKYDLSYSIANWFYAGFSLFTDIFNLDHSFLIEIKDIYIHFDTFHSLFFLLHKKSLYL